MLNLQTIVYSPDFMSDSDAYLRGLKIGTSFPHGFIQQLNFRVGRIRFWLLWAPVDVCFRKSQGTEGENKSKEETAATISKDKVNLYDDNLSDIRIKSFASSSDYKAVNEVLSIGRYLMSIKKLKFLKVGYYVTMDGTSHPNIKYKYAGDSSSKEVISAVFEDDGSF
ncbi:hypothetical protein FQA39_LY18798 [Lamprigera yunnana]|nr:hypothetical protein FQA39_LY18798 [Lamprigera yunnana]